MSCQLAVHGGAGSIRTLDDAATARARSGLARALLAGAAVLEAGGPALDAVEAAVRVLEDDPSFNAGCGSALTREGTIEMDAAVMDGASGRAGAVACVTKLRHPLHAARLVMERTSHVLLVGPGATAFALAQGAEPANESDLITERALRELERVLRTPAGDPSASRGTVGAVARDAQGRLAAGTSTGGITGKLPGRVGDSPLIGAGTWADSRCAISATGDGELFIRTAFAHRVGMELQSRPAGIAAAEALARVQALGGSGGCIIMPMKGDAVLVQLVDMYRGCWAKASGPLVAVQGGDRLAPP